MKSLSTLTAAEANRLTGVFFDIDDTVTHEGRIVPEAFDAFVAARKAGLRLVPITGRPAGWVDHIARAWPVDGVVGENGGLWFYLADGRMHRCFAQDAETRRRNRTALDSLATSLLSAVPGCALASDQNYRELDLAIDFCEDVPPLPRSAIDAIVHHFEAAGATCKVSSIHVNGWFGNFNKLEGCKRFLQDRWNLELADVRNTWAFVGDSANDGPMFEYFPLSFGVANVRDFLDRLDTPPTFVADQVGGWGFAEIIARVLALRE